MVPKNFKYISDGKKLSYNFIENLDDKNRKVLARKILKKLSGV